MQTMNSVNDGICVNRLLRCRKTRRYFSGEGWTSELTQAKNFPSQFDAIRACLEHRLLDVDLVLRAPGAEFDLFSTALR
jgi:hypothetical protein